MMSNNLKEIVYDFNKTEDVQFSVDDRENLERHHTQYISRITVIQEVGNKNNYYRELERIFPEESFSAYFYALSSIATKEAEVRKFIESCADEIKELKNYDINEFYQQMKGIMRILPFIESICGDTSRSYFIDISERSIGIVIFGNGTLKVKFKKGNIAEFNHAKKTEYGGMVSSNGRIKLTKYLKNSSYVKSFLHLVK